MEICGWPFGTRGVTRQVLWVTGFLKNFHIISLFMSPLGKKSPKKNPCWRYCEILDEKEEHKYMQSQMPLYKVFDLSYT